MTNLSRKWQGPSVLIYPSPNPAWVARSIKVLLGNLSLRSVVSVLIVPIWLHREPTLLDSRGILEEGNVFSGVLLPAEHCNTCLRSRANYTLSKGPLLHQSLKDFKHLRNKREFT